MHSKLAIGLVMFKNNAEALQLIERNVLHYFAAVAFTDFIGIIAQARVLPSSSHGRSRVCTLHKDGTRNVYDIS
jgi:hypothetical protein